MYVIAAVKGRTQTGDLYYNDRFGEKSYFISVVYVDHPSIFLARTIDFPADAFKIILRVYQRNKILRF